MEQHVIARADQHDRPIDATAFASKHLWNAANDLLADVTSMVSRWCARLNEQQSAQLTTEKLVQVLEAFDAAG
jgi:hypothetical protein